MFSHSTFHRLPTVRAFLLRLIVACLLPGVIGSAALFAYQYQQTRRQIDQITVMTARALMQAVDNHLQTVQVVAQSLSQTPSLQAGNLSEFHRLARTTARHIDLEFNVVLRDARGRQLINTAVDYGQPLAPPPAPEQVQAVFETGSPQVSNLFIGPVRGRLLMSVDVPVMIDGRVRYALGVGIPVEQFAGVLRRQNLPADWIASILDRHGVIVARTHAPQQFVGQFSSPSLRALLAQRSEGEGESLTLEGIDVQTFFSRSSTTGWAVAIGTPTQTADIAFVQTASRMAAGIGLLFTLGTLVAWRLGGRISSAFQGLIEVADNIAQLAWMADPEGRIQWFNRRWYAYTGARADTPPQACWQASLHPQHAARVQAELDRCLKAGTPWEDTFPLRAHDGQYRWFLSRAFALRDAKGQVVSWFGTHTDITVELQAQEALREADQRKDEFMAILAHELRNPLAPVRTAVEIVRRIDGLQPAQRRACEVIARQVAHMARLIDDLLDVSRIARGKMALQRERCDFAAIARQTAADYRDTLEAMGLALVIEASPGPIWVDGDPVRLAQMVGNLLGNAIRFTESGGQVRLLIEGDPATHTARVSVIDTGIGIAPEFLPKLFDPFSQAHQDLARSKGGLGLGLALTRGLAQMQGGTVEVRSEGLGHGATFVLTLPMRAAESEERAPTAPTNVSPEALRILVIEDNVDAAQSLADLLSLLGHQVRVAFDGEHGVQAARDERPDVVISDIGLPGAIDGYGVAARLRALPECAGVRLIALSGYVDAQARERARQAGFDAHIAKPADLPALEAALRAS